MKTLVLFSGGKDSFITACRLIEEGHQVMLLSFNNGCICGEHIFRHGAKRLENRYGADRCTYAGVYNTAPVVMHLTKEWADTPYRDMADTFPDLTNAQLSCLHCQSAMWAAAVAFCRARDIRSIASGYKKTDLFCTGMAGYRNALCRLCRENGVRVLFPVWDVEWDDTERDAEMERHRFLPQVFEPKCLIGRPVSPQDKGQETTLLCYFRIYVEPRMQEQVDSLVPIFKNMHLTGESMQVLDYPVPDGSYGLF